MIILAVYDDLPYDFAFAVTDDHGINACWYGAKIDLKITLSVHHDILPGININTYIIGDADVIGCSPG